MNVVADLVAHEGVLAGSSSAGSNEKPSPGQAGTRMAIKLIFVSLILLPLCLGISFKADSPVPLFPPATILLIGFFWLIYSIMFGEGPLALGQSNRRTQGRLTMRQAASLPQPQNAMEGFMARAADTGEILEPPGVTDHTTRLLE
jgi:hypothetical protein